MNNVSPGNNAADGGEAQNTTAAAPAPSPSEQQLKNGVQRQQERQRERTCVDYNCANERDIIWCNSDRIKSRNCQFIDSERARAKDVNGAGGECQHSRQRYRPEPVSRLQGSKAATDRQAAPQAQQGGAEHPADEDSRGGREAGNRSEEL